MVPGDEDQSCWDSREKAIALSLLILFGLGIQEGIVRVGFI